MPVTPHPVQPDCCRAASIVEYRADQASSTGRPVVDHLRSAMHPVEAEV